MILVVSFVSTIALAWLIGFILGRTRKGSEGHGDD